LKSAYGRAKISAVEWDGCRAPASGGRGSTAVNAATSEHATDQQNGRAAAMTRLCWVIVAYGIVTVASVPAAAGEGSDDAKSFAGEWRTSIGIVKLEQNGSDVTGTYGNTGQFTLRGTVAGERLTFEYQEGQVTGDAHWNLDELGHAFQGDFKIRGGQAGQWLGWRPDPQARANERGEIGGMWLTDLGLMQLVQNGDKVTGRYARGGASEIQGKLLGRSFEFTYKAFRSGKGWFDLSAAGDSFAGAAAGNGFPGWYGWRGRAAPEFVRHVKLAAGTIVDGSTTGLLTYAIRAPEGYREQDDKKWPAIVILHGSNMNGRAYVNTIAEAWPDVARDYLLLGINGETPSAMGVDPQFNYTYVNYVGRSTFKGFPGTDRESPALVAEALEDLRGAYPIARYFVGGHSQGAFLTYSLLMNFPDQLAGAFPASGGLIFQCEPSAYEDEKLRAAQRSVPLAIVHGKNDPLVEFRAGEYAAALFAEEGWPAWRLFADDTEAGHMFARLPVGAAIRWLEAQTADDLGQLLDFAETRIKADRGYRDAVAALNRARALDADGASDDMRARRERLAREVDAKATVGAAQFLPKVQAPDAHGNDWIDGFLVYRDDFEFAPAAREVMQAFATLRAEHEAPAKKLLAEANAAFQKGDRDEGYAKYEQIVAKHYAASPYRNVKRWLAERK
jgi:predicted esterase